MDSIIIILGIILIILILLNHVTIVATTNTTTHTQANCSKTTFGCCPDGVNSKIDYFGSNCPGYRPGPGYYPIRHIPPGPRMGPRMGGCAGTRYGCCPNNQIPKYDERGSNCIL
jgi:hypothetical protein